jgi:hypothetical protein
MSRIGIFPSFNWLPKYLLSTYSVGTEEFMLGTENIIVKKIQSKIFEDYWPLENWFLYSTPVDILHSFPHHCLPFITTQPGCDLMLSPSLISPSPKNICAMFLLSMLTCLTVFLRQEGTFKRSGVERGFKISDCVLCANCYEMIVLVEVST